MIVRNFSGRSMLISNEAVLSHEESTEKFKMLEDLEQKLYRKIFSFHVFVPNLFEKLKSFFTAHDRQRYPDFEFDIEHILFLFKSVTKDTKKTFDKTVANFCLKLITLDAPRELVRFVLKLKSVAMFDELGFKVCSPWSQAGYSKWYADVVKYAADAHKVKNRLVEANQGLVGTIVRKYFTKTNEAQTAFDLHQEGAIGLYRAIDKFEWRREHRFSTYANWWIRHAVTRAIADKQKLIRLPVHIADNAKIIGKFQNEFLATHSRYPSVMEIRKGTGIHKDTIEVVVEGPAKIISGDEERGSNLSSYSDDASRTFWDTIPDNSVIDPLDVMSNAELRHSLENALKMLTERERDIILKRFGCGEEKEQTLQEIGEATNLSRERIRQIQYQALSKMRTALSKAIPQYTN